MKISKRVIKEELGGRIVKGKQENVLGMKIIN